MITSHNAAETLEFGRELGAELCAGDVIALAGDLGAGKTHFVKGVAAGLGHTGEVTSPTFTLVHEYTGGRLPLFHFDFYRLESAEEVLQIGFEDYLTSGGVLIIEWADKFADLLPKTTRAFHFAVGGDDTRVITSSEDEA
ncbi:MAG TPA: tRNA (adenosine(37)-N6)-threonylcarbamoyltransferase complex ATPase subunit type 1 TsaE [Chthoniobacteraceae bacterium]|jgi:tRNA threonylcarbamoyladenosine biosynthesis protein TsaE